MNAAAAADRPTDNAQTTRNNTVIIPNYLTFSISSPNKTAFFSVTYDWLDSTTTVRRRCKLPSEIQEILPNILLDFFMKSLSTGPIYD